MINSYETRFTAFIDILGFSDMICRSASDVVEVSLDSIIEALKIPDPAGEGQIIIGTAGDISASNHKLTQFSDSIVISTDRTDAGLLHLINHCERIGFQLLKLGFLCRGGVSEGLLFHENNIVLGPALIEAYHLESRIAQYPRIILSKDVEKYALSMTAGQGTVINRMLNKCDDFYMVHVLRLLSFVLGIPGDIGSWEKLYWDIKFKLINEIDRLKDVPDKKEKVVWFKKYFDEAIPSNDPRLLISLLREKGVPT